MKKIFLISALILIAISCKERSKEIAQENKKTEILAQETWQDLTLKDWQAFGGGEVPKFWTENEGMIIFSPPTREERKDENGNRQSFNIVSKKAYSSFELSLEWKISEAGNSGVMWGVSDDQKYKEPYQTGLEIQILDNDKHPDAKNGTSHRAGALYDLVSPREDATKPVGEWNITHIRVDHNTNNGTSVLNGVEVASFPVGGEELQELLKGSKFETWDGFGTFKTGKLSLQDHNDVVTFRNIRIKEL